MSSGRSCLILMMIVFLKRSTTQAEHLRAVRDLPSGFGTMLDELSQKFPNLDPIVIEHHDFDYNRNTCNAKGSVDDLHIRGISGMDLDIKDMDSDAMRYHIAVSFPVFSLTGRFRFSVLMCERQLQESAGKFSLTMDNLNVTTRANFTNVDGLMQMDYLDIKVDLSDIKFDVDSLFGQPKLGELLTSIMKTHGKEIFYTLKPFMKVCTQKNVKKMVNRYIAESKNPH